MSISTEPIRLVEPAPHHQPQPVAPVSVSLLNGPVEHENWDAYVRAAENGSWFHTTAWMTAVEGAFGHQPYYLQAERAGKTIGVLPLFLVRSLLGGRMLISVPYAVYGGALFDDAAAGQALHAALHRHVQELGVSTVDLRSLTPQFEGGEANDRYVTYRRTLPETAGDVAQWLPRKARAAARSGKDKHALTVECGRHLLPIVWRLYSASMRRLASINYPYRFFELLVKLAPERTLTSVVYYRGHPVAGLLTLLHGETVMPYFVGLDRRYRFTNMSNFLYLSLMEWAVRDGRRVFDFGRSRRDNPGCCDFKRFHGFEATPLGYQRMVAPGAHPPDLTPTSARFGLARRMWPYLPLALTRPLGAWVSRHIPG
ncbi:MAG: FemAB family PEP-CTERM system-associated protein [bacterium]|nr:FemAB family PEP-CTERM system-associated protein [bacterium]